MSMYKEFLLLASFIEGINKVPDEDNKLIQSNKQLFKEYENTKNLPRKQKKQARIRILKHYSINEALLSYNPFNP